MAFYKVICVFSNLRRGMWSQFLKVSKTASALDGLNVTCHCLVHCDKSADSLNSLPQNTAYVRFSKYVIYTCL